MVILIKSPKAQDQKTFDLASIQASIRKEPKKRMTKEEHELILGAVKQNIEDKFDTKIDKAYFCYVLSQKNKHIVDIDTKNDCEKNGVKYI